MGGRKKEYASAHVYEKKLAKVIERLGVEQYNFNWDRWSCYIEFRYRGELYRFDHSVDKAKARGVNLTYGSDAFAQVVLALEDLARMVERGIYELQTWVAGMKYLPPPIEIPSFFRFLGFEEIPSDPEEVKARFRTMSKQMHPDVGGKQEDFEALKRASEQAMQYFAKTRGGEDGGSQ